ncbi:NADPH-dependent diflavin oxidoreductase ATR3-like protein, partial [Trifolium pratense]
MVSEPIHDSLGHFVGPPAIRFQIGPSTIYIRATRPTLSAIGCVKKSHIAYLTSLDILDNARSLHHGNSSSGRSGHPDCFLKMVKNLPLTRPNFGKDVRHFEFEFVSH